MEWKYGPAAQSINQTLSFLFIQSSIKLNFFNLNWIDWWRKEELIVDELLAAPQFVSRIELPRSFLSFNQPFHFFSLHSKKFHYWFHSSFTHKLILQSTNHSINSNQLIHQSNWILIEWIELMDWWMNVDWLVAHESKKVCLFSFIGGAPAAGSGHNPPKEQTTQLHFHSFIPLGPPARQFSFSSSARPLGRASWKRERNWMSEGSHQSVHLPQIQIKLTHRFVFVYNSWLAAYTVIILLFHFISFL